MEQWLNEACSLSSRQLSQRLAKERQVTLGAEQVRRILKKRYAGSLVNIMGVWEEETRLEYTLKVGTIKTRSYLRFMNWQAQRAMKRLYKTGKLTVIIPDNASIHRSQ
ncbi:MAG: hypothetical protein AAFQ91_31215, partial [Cyanobacteria bacterium J06621_15]